MLALNFNKLTVWKNEVEDVFKKRIMHNDNLFISKIIYAAPSKRNNVTSIEMLKYLKF